MLIGSLLFFQFLREASGGIFDKFFMFPFFFIVVMPAIIRFFQNRNPDYDLE